MNEDMSDVFQKMNDMIKNNQIPDEIKNMLNQFSSNSSASNSNSSSSSNSNSNSSSNFNTNSNNYGMSSNLDKNNINSSNDSTSSEHSTKNNDSDFLNFDMTTMLKMKSIIDSMNKPQNDPRANLLKSLKPYLRSSRRDKVDQYVKLFSMGKVFEMLNPLGGDKKNDV